MSDRDDKEKLFGDNIGMVDEMIGWLHTWNKAIGPRYSRGDNVIGLTWAGRITDFNRVYFRQLKDEFRIGLKLRGDVSDQCEQEVRKARLVAWYSDWNRRLLIRLTPNEFAKHKSLLQRLLRTTYEQSIKPRSQIRRGI